MGPEAASMDVLSVFDGHFAFTTKAADARGRERVFTDHTLAHPLNCRGGVVAHLSA